MYAKAEAAEPQHPPATFREWLTQNMRPRRPKETGHSYCEKLTVEYDDCLSFTVRHELDHFHVSFAMVSPLSAGRNDHRRSQDRWEMMCIG